MTEQPLSRYQSLIGWGVADVSVIFMIVAWWFFAQGLPAFVMPTPDAVFWKLVAFVSDPRLFDHVVISFLRIGAAVTIAMTIAMALALLTRAFPILDETVERRLLTFLNSFPSVGWAILAVIWFGISNLTVIFIQVAIVLPFCLIGILSGLKQADVELTEMGRSFTRSRRLMFMKVTLPLMMPFFIASLRIAYGIAWKVALVSELFGASSGLGYLLMQGQIRADAALVFACCLAIVLIFGTVDALLLRPLARQYSFNKGE
ncbi:ABC transporter permease [Pararhizobium haloflavum]|uniref:ABC transporter permease n=1 Tax=Pararhizobium haloflavum TaxID=2037914 RepID=UPI000C1A84C5|nr:ABC transporter permease subunit [Pararhizobium haloflavum]